MEVFKWILLIATIGLTLWLVIDTTIYFIKKFKKRKLEKQENKEENNNEQ